MAQTLNELKWQGLSNETGIVAGKLNELEYAWLQAKYPLVLGLSLNELWHYHLTTQGYTGNIGEMMWDALEDLGYEGTLNEKFWQFWGDLAGGGGEKFIVTNVEFQNNIITCYTNQSVTATTGVGFTLTVNGTPQAMAVDSFGQGGIIFLTAEIPIGSLVFLSYDDGVGDTLHNTTPLTPFTDLKVTESPSTFAFAAAGSLHLFTDGVIQNHTLLDVAAGVTPASYSNDGLSLPDHEGVYHTNKAGEPPWYGARKVTNLKIYNNDLQHVTVLGQSWTGGNGATIDSSVQMTLPASNFTFVDCNYNLRVIGSEITQPYTYSFEVRVLAGDPTAGLTIQDPLGNRVDIGGQVDGTWKRFAFTYTPSTTEANLFRFQRRYLPVDSLVLEVRNVQIEAGSLPSDVVPTQGASGRRWYDNENGNTVLNNVVTEADGATIDPYPKLYISPSLLNRQTRSYKLAFWTTQGIGGVDQDNYTGLEGIVGRASRLTDADPSSYFACTSNIDINATAQVTTQWAIRKQASQTAWPGLGNAGGNGYSANYIAFNQVTGAYNVLAGTFDKIIVDGSNPEWWFITLQVPNVGSPYPQKIWAALSVDGLSASGSAQGFVDVGYAFCSEEVDADQVKASAPVLTNGSAVNQAASIPSWPIANVDDTEGCWFAEMSMPFDAGTGEATQQVYLSTLPVGNASPTGWIMNIVPSFAGNQNMYSRALNGNAIGGYGFVADESFKFGVSYSLAEVLQEVRSQDGWGATARQWTGSYKTGLHATGQAGFRPYLIGNIRRYDLPYAEAKAKIDELMAGAGQIVTPDLTLTAGDNGGSRVGFTDGVYGTVTPDQLTTGDAILSLFCNNSNGRVRFKVEAEHPQGAFTSMEIVGVGTLLAANATYDYDGVETEWRWDSTGFNLVSGTVYAVQFT